MKLRIVWVGKTKNPQQAKLCEDYIGRIRHFLPLEIVEVGEAQARQRAAPRKEAKLLAALGSDRVVVLDPNGKSFTSEQFAKFVQQHMSSDPRPLTFVIGDFAGLPVDVKKRADVQWSLSPLTFTHDLTRVLLLEQIYRALSIIHNFPYSK